MHHLDLPYIIAVDFDGVLVEDKFPLIGEPNLPLINKLIDLKFVYGDKLALILWTSRCENHGLNLAVDYCANYGLIFDAVNDHIPAVKQKWGGESRKVYADIYLDDHNLLLIDFNRNIDEIIRKDFNAHGLNITRVY